METIFKRRSIRKYTDKEVSYELIKKLLKAGMAAPSAGNAQTWEFVVIDDQDILDQIPKFHPYSKMVPDASKAILVCGDIEKELYNGFWPQDCSAATQNILLEAADRDLGAVWLGVYPEEDRINRFQKLFNLPENIIPFSLIPVGYPAVEKKKNDRYDENKVHYNQW
ncbi:MAG: nitroreductase family protein [Bacillota bacterium]